MIIEPKENMKNVYEISAFDELPKIISTLYNITLRQANDWVTECVLFYNWGNGHALTDDIEKCEFIGYDEWVAKCAPPNHDFIDGGVGPILADAANHDLIPEGFYVVSFTW